MRPPPGNRTRAIMNGLPDKLGKLGKMFISKQDNATGLQLKLVRMVLFKRLKSLGTSVKSRVSLGLFRCHSFRFADYHKPQNNRWCTVMHKH